MTPLRNAAVASFFGARVTGIGGRVGRTGMVIRQRSGKGKPAKVVWRISAAAPLGEYVRAPAEQAAELKPEPMPQEAQPTVTDRGWHDSTHELVHGLDVREEPLDTLPDELWIAFFRK